MMKIKSNQNLKTEMEFTNRILERYILGDLPAHRRNKITERANGDPELSARIRDLKIQKEKESKDFLKKFNASKMIPLIQARASQSDISRKKESSPKPFYLQPAGMATFSILILVGVTLSSQFFFKSNVILEQSKNIETPVESPHMESFADQSLTRQKNKEEPFLANNRGPAKADSADDSNMENKKEKGLGNIHFNSQTPASGERLLEYQVHLNFEVDNFEKTRHRLFSMINKYGYISESAASGKNLTTMQTTLYVRSSQLNNFLLEVETLGKLTYEEINAIDHTENNEWQKRLIHREQVRSNRRGNALQGTPSRKNWQERENSLSNSEDSLDQAEHEKWKIKDRITWARIDISLRTPQEGPSVKLPLYKETLIIMVNFLLVLSNFLIYLAPLGLVAFFLYRFWMKKRKK